MAVVAQLVSDYKLNCRPLDQNNLNLMLMTDLGQSLQLTYKCKSYNWWFIVYFNVLFCLFAFGQFEPHISELIFTKIDISYHNKSEPRIIN